MFGLLLFEEISSGSAEFGDAEVLRRLIAADESIGLPGIVLQELLSGVREELQFEKLSRPWRVFQSFLPQSEPISKQHE